MQTHGVFFGLFAAVVHPENLTDGVRRAFSVEFTDTWIYSSPQVPLSVSHHISCSLSSLFPKERKEKTVQK